ncbi:MAG: amino-acid N-acetyltransferase [Sporichthyaceae bacterium]
MTGRPTLRKARTADVSEIRRFIDVYANDRILLSKPTVALYEDIQEFWVAEADLGSGYEVVGCGALHVMWEDLAEVRTLAVDPRLRGAGIGHLLLGRLVEAARELGVSKLFCLTFEVEFFTAHGFVEIDGVPVEPGVYSQIVQSYDEGVAEFLDLERVKPNTLGNTRMLLSL